MDVNRKNILKSNIIDAKKTKVSKRPVLNVMLTCRERTYFTQKVIEALHENTSKFHKINIYCYDNLSDLGSGRMSIFEELLEEKKIVYYSYDTTTSTNKSFPKSIIYNDWFYKMATFNKMPNTDETRYYLMIDNDMVVCPYWDEFFLSAADHALPSTRYLVKRPGGMVARRGKIHTKEVENRYNKEEKFDLMYASFGGGSGFWFMNQNMLNKHVWIQNVAVSSYGNHRGDDIAIWRAIDKFNGKQTQYVAGITALKEKPLVLHMGSVLGSMCNFRPQEYVSQKDTQAEADEILSELSVSEIIEKYKYDKQCTTW